jgi:hypothetical protein
MNIILDKGKIMTAMKIPPSCPGRDAVRSTALQNRDLSQKYAFMAGRKREARLRAEVPAIPMRWAICFTKRDARSCPRMTRTMVPALRRTATRCTASVEFVGRIEQRNLGYACRTI